MFFRVCPGQSKPVITPDVPHLVVQKGGQLELRCVDVEAGPEAAELRWRKERGRRVEGERGGKDAVLIDLASAQPQHMGRYTCQNIQTGEGSSIYVYVKGE